MILKRDRAGKLHDHLGHFASNKVASTAYRKTPAGKFEDAGGRVLTSGEVNRLRRGVEIKRKDTKEIKRRRKIVKRRYSEIRKRRRKVKERAPSERVRKRAPRKTVKEYTKRERTGGVGDWKEQINGALEATLNAVAIDGKITVVRNADGSVDGELRLQIPKDIEPREIIKTLSEYAVIPKRTWFTVGMRYARDALTGKHRDRYITWMSALDVAPTYTYDHNRGEQFATALSICDDMEGVHDAVADQIALRINWNGNDTRPNRKGER